MWRTAVLLALLPLAALAEGRSIIVLDASGSMWGQIDGQTKLEIARDALDGVLGAVDPGIELGLMAYGHRSKGDCSDIELVVPPGPATGPAISSAARAMQFLGKTPLTEAVRQAAADLRSTEEKATVILITDGVETCEGDPCALGAELEASGIDFTAHVVGFGLSEEQGRAVACLADTTGGRYIQAGDAQALETALKDTVLAEPAPPPPPVPEPEPEPVIVNNLDPVVRLVAGGEVIEAEYGPNLLYTVYTPAANGSKGEIVTGFFGEMTAALPPGDYILETKLDNAVVVQAITLTDTAVASPEIVLDAGVLNLRILVTAGGEPAQGAFWEMKGAGVDDYSYDAARRVFPAGEYALETRFGEATQSTTLVITAGTVTDHDAIMGTGVAAIDAEYAPGMKVTGGAHFVEVLAAQQSIDGSRETIAYSYGEGQSFDLPAGGYVARVTLQGAVAEVPFAIETGKRSDVIVNLNAGIAFVTSGTDQLKEVLGPPDIAGNRPSVIYSFDREWTVALPAGEYVVRTDSGSGPVETPLVISAGLRTDLTVP